MDLCNCKTQSQTETKKTQIKHVVKSEVFEFSADLTFCRNCKKPIVDKNLSKRIKKEAFQLYAKKHGLLSGDEIQERREKLGLTQFGFGKYLNVPFNNVCFWERLSRLQSKSTDDLIRIKTSPEYVRDHKEEIERLKSSDPKKTRKPTFGKVKFCLA